MTIRLTNPITGKTRTQRARLTKDHVMSRYGEPVLIVGDEPLDVANAVLQNARVIKPPKRPDQIDMLKTWQDNASAMIGRGAIIAKAEGRADE